MSQENEEAFARALDAGQRAFNDGDYERAFAGLAPDVEWYSGDWVLDAGVLRGRDAVVRHFISAREAGGWHVELQGVLAAGAQCLVVRQQGRAVGRTTKIQSTMEFFQVYEFGLDRLVFRVREYESRRDALEAVGLEE